MRLNIFISIFLACSRSFVACRPSVQAGSVHNRANHGRQPGATKHNAETAVDIAEVVHTVRDLVKHGEFNLIDLVRKGAEAVNDFALESENPKLAARSPMTRNVHEIRKRIDTGDFDLNKAAKDGIAYIRRAATDVDINALAGSGLTFLRNKTNEHDLNEVVMGWLSHATATTNEGLSLRLKRSLLSSAMKSFFSTNTFQGLAKVGMNTLIKLARNVDFNALANQGLNLLSSTIGNADLNKMADKGTRSLDGLSKRMNLNELAAKGLGLLLD